MPRVGSGSNVQPSSSDAADGGSAGTGPWAATEVGLAIASAPNTPAPTSEPDESARSGPCRHRRHRRTNRPSRAARDADAPGIMAPVRPSGGSAAISLTVEHSEPVLADACAEDLHGEFPPDRPHRAHRPGDRGDLHHRRRHRDRRPAWTSSGPASAFVTGLYPPDGRHAPGRADPRPVHDRLPDRGRHLLPRRGPDPVDGPALPAQADGRRACRRRPTATPSPRSSGPSSRRSSSRSCSSSRGRPSTTSRSCRPIRRPGSRRSPASSSGRSSTSTRPGENTRLHRSSSRPARTAGWCVPAGRTVQLSLESPDVIHAFYVPQFLFKRDVVPGRTNVFEFTVGEQFAGQTFRGQCAELCGAGHRADAVRRPCLRAGRLRRLARGAGSPRPTPRRRPAPSGAPIRCAVRPAGRPRRWP